MAPERQIKAVGYVRVATVDGQGGASQVQRHKDTLIACCGNSGIVLTHMIVDIATREGRGRALDLLVMERASVLVVPALSQLSRKSGELGQMLDHYFSPPSGVADLIAVADGIDTRTSHGRMLLDLVRCFARIENENGGVYHA